MKVLDLQCTQLHVFEGWFASEEDFVSQRGRGLIACPVCGDVALTKRLSAPRLNIGGMKQQPTPMSEQELVAVEPVDANIQAMQATWLAAARKFIQNTDDVGDSFAEEARRMHYGETRARGIRGNATREETESLLDEGIAVMPILLPDALKGQLQ